MKIYRLQWAFMFNEDGSLINAEDYCYHDTVFEYEDRDEAMEDRIKLMAESKDKYIRIVEVK
jgi:hypothetical protein